MAKFKVGDKFVELPRGLFHVDDETVCVVAITADDIIHRMVQKFDYTREEAIARLQNDPDLVWAILRDFYKAYESDMDTYWDNLDWAIEENL